MGTTSSERASETAVATTAGASDFVSTKTYASTHASVTFGAASSSQSTTFRLRAQPVVTLSPLVV
ncbi:hypothetical protein N7447_002410 [Penicillium robsamsonii]|uniref:uncharacterized protein n=1 Tax=Penicillium robsamsonii TaxID=1792511 RepID=UPI002547DDFE|nr:uncharacterized protein N7447_002410 [Penicillium robsamsonii]KAJ5836384.1 hypothetical protein N7447_002410 [Penicillium robsamsonii]